MAFDAAVPNTRLLLLALAIGGMLLNCLGCTTFPKSVWPAAVENTSTLESRFAYARLSERHGQQDEAQRLYKVILKDDPTYAPANHRMAVIAAQTEQYELAHQYFQKALESVAPSAELLNDQGYTLYRENRLEEAEKVLRQAIALSPRYAPAHTNLGLVLGQQGKYQDCLECFSRVGSEAQAEANLAYILAQQNSLTEAQWHYKRALALDGDLKPAAEGLLAVSSRLPGQEPKTVVSTVGRSVKQPARPESPDGTASKTESTDSVRTVSTDDSQSTTRSNQPALFSWPSNSEGLSTRSVERSDTIRQP
jgi:Tfp pilus assembly protein PilF